ncbi:MAG: peptide deformylase [Candidatus Komeilibacteria bacterium]
MILPVLKAPHPWLRNKSQPVDNIMSADFQDWLDQLYETMRQEDGVGLAARQVGREEDVFVIDYGHGPMFFINAKIIHKSKKQNEDEEGCLSVPGVYGMVKRSVSLVIKYYDRQGQWHIKRFKDLAARIIQHEKDHNLGILFIDKVTRYTAGEELLTSYQDA